MPTNSAPPALANRLREIREAKGLTQMDVARRVGLTRQAIYSIETNRYQPNVTLALKLADVLDARVEEIFGREPSGPLLEGERLGTSKAAGTDTRVAVWSVRRRTFVLPLAELGAPLSYMTSADGLLLRGEKTRGSRARVRLFGAGSALAHNVVVAGCDPAMHIVAEWLRRERAPGKLLAWPMGSLAAIEALKRGEVHVAGLHVVDARSGESNVPFVRKHLRNTPVTLVTFADWQAGLLVAPKNPKRIRTLADLARRGVRIVNREAGSGARILLDDGLRQAGLDGRKLTGYDDEADSHLEIGQRVAEGRADAGVGVEAIARQLGIGFVPLRTERYDLVVPDDLLHGHAGVGRLIDVLGRGEVRAEVEALGGYDTSRAGRHVPTRRP